MTKVRFWSRTGVPRGGKVKSLLPGLLIASLWGALLTPEVALAATVRVGGAGFGIGVMKVLAEAFGKSRPGTRIDVVPSLGSSGGIKALNQGALDIAISGRPLREPEKGSGAHALELTRSPLVPVAHKDVDAEGVTTWELVAIHRGETLNWPDGSRLRLVLRPETDTVTRMLRGLSPALDRAMTLAQAREGLIVAVTDQDSADLVEKIPGALAFATLTQLYSEKRRLKILSLNGQNPALDRAGHGSYPFYVSLFLITTPGTSSAALEFLDFIRSREGERLLTKYGNELITGRSPSQEPRYE